MGNCPLRDVGDGEGFWEMSRGPRFRRQFSSASTSLRGLVHLLPGASLNPGKSWPLVVVELSVETGGPGSRASFSVPEHRSSNSNLGVTEGGEISEQQISQLGNCRIFNNFHFSKRRAKPWKRRSIFWKKFSETCRHVIAFFKVRKEAHWGHPSPPYHHGDQGGSAG